MPPARRSARAASSQHSARGTAQPYTRANRQRSPASASIARPANGKASLRLTVKAPPSKLRQATSGSSIPPNPYTDAASESDTTPQPAVTRAARSTRNPRAIVEHNSDEDDEEDDEDEEEEEEEEEAGEVDSEDEEMEDADRQLNANDESGSGEDAEDDEGEEEEEEDDDDDGTEDELVLHHPPRPIIKQERVPGKSAPNVTVTAPPEGPLKSVEDKEMEDEEDEEEEEELSDLDSNANENDEDDDDDDDDIDDDDEEGISRSATPDLSKLTRRQRGQYEEADENLMALSNEAQKKKHLTAEEHAVRRAEMARRRKNLSEKRNEEEKMDTINKLLKKPAPKRRTRAEILAAHADSTATPGAEEGEEERADPLFVRWVNARDGSRLGVPDEWLEAPIGGMFRGAGGGRMVEEVA